MDAGRMAVLVVVRLHEAGFLNTDSTNAPCAVVREVFKERMDTGELLFKPDDLSPEDKRVMAQDLLRLAKALLEEP